MTRAVDYNIFYDSDFLQNTMNINLPILHGTMESLSKTVHLKKITIWLKIYRDELPYQIKLAFESLLNITLNIPKIIIPNTQNTSVLYNDVARSPTTTFETLNNNVSFLKFLLDSSINSPQFPSNNSFPNLYLKTGNMDTVCHINYNSNENIYYTNNIQDYYKILYTTHVNLVNKDGDCKIVENPLNLLNITNCCQLHILLNNFLLVVDISSDISSTTKSFNIIELFDTLQKYINEIECSLKIICENINVWNIDYNAKQVIQTILNNNNISGLSFIIKLVSKLLHQQLDILYIELPRFTSVKYIIANLVFKNKGFVTDSHVYSNNPYFNLNSNALNIPTNLLMKPFISRGNFSNLPEYWCNNIDELKMLEFYEVFPYYNNIFRINEFLTIEIYTQYGLLLPITIRDLGKNRELTNNIKGENALPQLSIIDAHLIDSTTALIELFNDVIISNSTK